VLLRRAGNPIDIRPHGYRNKDTTMVIVSKAIVAIKTLWPQRAINPSMLKLPVKKSQNTATWERLQFRRTNMGANHDSSSLGRCDRIEIFLSKWRFLRQVSNSQHPLKTSRLEAARNC
jgi:hypothetical protein